MGLGLSNTFSACAQYPTTMLGPTRGTWLPALPAMVSDWTEDAALVYSTGMIDQFLFCDWDEAPAAMDFEVLYGELFGRCSTIVDALVARRGDHEDPASWQSALELYIMAPAIINVLLNYSVCIQFGLPLHPTEYFDVDQTGSSIGCYGAEMEREAFDLLDRAIALSRAAYRLDPDFSAMAASLHADVPRMLRSFVYISRRDKYTWRAAEPAKVQALASSVLSARRPRLAIGAAHGSIMAGLLLAELLGCDLWFLRFSMFKRNDKAPVVSPRDEERISSYGDGSDILVFDEDSASGTTLGLLAARIKSIAPMARTGAVIRHLGSTFRPDHVGLVWSD